MLVTTIARKQGYGITALGVKNVLGDLREIPASFTLFFECGELCEVCFLCQVSLIVVWKHYSWLCVFVYDSIDSFMSPLCVRAPFFLHSGNSSKMLEKARGLAGKMDAIVPGKSFEQIHSPLLMLLYCRAKK
jgi:hypothetical protein